MTDAEYLRAITDHKIQIHCTEDMKAQYARLRAIADKLEVQEEKNEKAPKPVKFRGRPSS